MLEADTSDSQLFADNAIALLSTEELSRLEGALATTPEERRQVFIKRTRSKEGVTGNDIPVIELALRGLMVHEISAELCLEPKVVRRVLQKEKNVTFMREIQQGAEDALRNLMLQMTTTLRDLLHNPNPQVRLGAVREIAKINGLYADEQRKPTTAEDVVKEVLTLARESISLATESGSRRKLAITRVIEGNVDG